MNQKTAEKTKVNVALYSVITLQNLEWTNYETLHMNSEEHFLKLNRYFAQPHETRFTRTMCSTDNTV